MKLARLRIRNFRCFCREDWWEWIPNGGLNLLIGANGSGKTTVLDAIDIVLNWEGRTNRALIMEYDFPYCDTSKTIEIEATLTDMGMGLADFESDIQWVDKTRFKPIDESDEEPDEEKHEQAVIVMLEALRSQDDGEIQWKWLLPKFPRTDMEEAKELSRQQHEAIGYFHIQPAVSGGAFTLGEYSALGRHLRKMRYKLGRLPEKLKPKTVMPECFLGTIHCDDCEKRDDCLNEIDEEDEPDRKPTPLGKLLSEIASKAGNMLGESAWAGMEKSLGPRFGGLRSSLAAITLGLRASGENPEAFLPFERLSAGEKYALSFAMATTQVAGLATPILVMEEPETALYPAAIGQIIADLQSANSPQVIVSSHSESVVRRFGLAQIFVMNNSRKPIRLDNALDTVDQRLPLETIIMPGRTSALFVEKVIICEGAIDTIVGGYLDRLAGVIGSKHPSFATMGWCFFDAGGHEHVEETAKAMRKLDKRAVLLFDGDNAGKEAAEKTKGDFPTFVYRSFKDDEPKLETALLQGLDVDSQKMTIDEFQNLKECKKCTLKSEIRNCLEKKGCQSDISKRELKAKFDRCCLNQYERKKHFPRVFESLLKQIDGAQSGEIIYLDVDNVSQTGKGN